MREVTRYAKVTRAAIYAAMKKGRLKAIKVGMHYKISKAELDRYRMHKFSREERTVNGERIFDVERGTFSVYQVSKILSQELNRPCNTQRLYYLIRTGQLKTSRCGKTFVILREDLVDLIEKEKQVKNEDYRQLKFGRTA